MLSKINSIRVYFSTKASQLHMFLSSPRSERGEESARVAAITGLVLLIILAVMAIFRNALVAAFERIAALLGF
jgi:hypothetical protein